MDYQKIYDRLIDDARANVPAGYCEIHHIKPRCQGGDDSEMNLVKMTARSHFVAHLLLAKIHGGKLIYAAWGMSNSGRHTSRRYEWLRRMHARNVSVDRTGWKMPEETKRQIVATRRNNGGYIVTETMKAAIRKANKERVYPKGISPSAETRDAISRALTGRKRPGVSKKQQGGGNPFWGRAHTAEAKQKMRLAQLGKKHPYKKRRPISPDQKQRKSTEYKKKGYRPPAMFGNQFNKGKVWVSNAGLNINTLVREDQVVAYLARGFELGRSKIKSRESA